MRHQWFLSAALLLLCAGCATAPFDYPREASYAINPAEETHLKVAVNEWRSQNPGPSGFYPLVAGNDAFGARLRLIELAEKSIDLQYFLMKGDTAGQVFAGSLLAAADRGVRIRFLLDDVFTTVSDEELELLDAHPNIELRLYNPISRRGVGIFNYLADFKRANRRMHNKSFTVDNQVTIVGGRNIADEYFELRPEGEFLDLDVIGFGPVAADVSAVFDEFWNHSRSLPMEALVPQFTEAELEAVRREVDAEFRAAGESVYRHAVGSPLITDLTSNAVELYSASYEVMTDEPDKLAADIAPEHMVLVNRLEQIVSAAKSEVIVFTPYFVPQREGVEYWASVVDSGVRLIVVTNSLASNNHTAVHSAYSGFRKRIINAGVELYEVRADAIDQLPDSSAQWLTLHTKGMIIDRSQVFIGSLNLDPRSIEINSEMGIVIDNDELAGGLAEAALEQISEIAYRVDLDENNRIRWRATINGEAVELDSEPSVGLWRRFVAFLLKIVPNSQL